jgi:hypothetical protein
MYLVFLGSGFGGGLAINSQYRLNLILTGSDLRAEGSPLTTVLYKADSTEMVWILTSDYEPVSIFDIE